MDFPISIKLRFTGHQKTIVLRELNGFDQAAITDTGTRSAISLLDQLIIYEDATENSLNASAIVTADRDNILAELYTCIFGNNIKGSFACKSCGENFSMDFQLSALRSHLLTQHPLVTDHMGTFHVEDGNFRLPTGEDELATLGLVAGNAVDELLKRCLVDGKIHNAEKVQQAMSDIAPILHTDIATTCPECGVEQTALFDIQTFLLERLKLEQTSITRDVHRLAGAYKWTYNSIMELPRSLRKRLVSLVETELQIS
jgi:hypothetical protein